MSNTIHTPGLVKVDDHGATSATFAIEPLHSGYGMTLGNSPAARVAVEHCRRGRDVFQDRGHHS